MNTDKPTLDQVITYLTHRLDGMTMPGAVRMTTAARDYLVELQAENEKLRAELERMKGIMRYNGIMVIPSKYPGGRSEWNIPKPRGQKED